MKIYFKTMFLIIVTVSFFGCSYKVLTPPTKFVSIKTPAVIAKDEQQIAYEGTGMLDVFGFGPALGVHSFTYSKGLGKSKEISIRPFMGMVGNVDDCCEQVKIHPIITGINIDYKLNPSTPLNRHFALEAGSGYLFSHYAQVLSVNAGWIIGYENRYLVPFLSQDIFFNFPFLTRVIPGDDDSDRSSWKHPTTTVGTKISGGIKIHLGKNFSIALAKGIVVASSETNDITMIVAAYSIEYKF
jgi:hypothetical protein